jgi:membrane protein
MILFLKNIANEVTKIRVAKYSAALAFYAIYALAPMIIIFVSIGGLTIGEQIAEEKIVLYFQERLGDKAVPFFESILSSIKESKAHLLFSFVGPILMLYGLFHFFSTLREAFFSIFGIDFSHGPNLPKTFSNFLRTVGYDIILAILIFILLLLNTLAPLLLGFSNLWFITFLSGIPFIDFLLTFLLTFLTLSFIYRFVSAFQLSWKNAFLGSFLASFLLAVLNTTLALYFGLFGSAHAIYGASASLVAFLLWVYFSIKILLIGALAGRIFSNYFNKSTFPQ